MILDCSKSYLFVSYLKLPQVTSIRTKKQAKVDSVKGLFGFLDFEVEEGKKLFFHMSEVQGGGSLYPGDSVEFSIVTNQASVA